MLTYTFENRGRMSYYEYLYIRIKDDILNGTLSAGEKLPSKRAFAAQLSVSVMTVENAYAQLMVEGYIYAVQRKGYYVADTSFLEKSYFRENPKTEHNLNDSFGREDTGEKADPSFGRGYTERTMNRYSEQGDVEENTNLSLVREGAERIVNRYSEQVDTEKKADPSFKQDTQKSMHHYSTQEDMEKYAEKRRMIDFTSNSIRPENFPFSVWAKLMRRVLTESREELLLKPPAQGMWELRTAIAEHLRRFRGMEAKPGQVVVGAGTEYLYGLLIQLLGRDRVYGVENPGYRKISRIYRSNGVTYRKVGLDENGVDIGALRESGADIIHISPSHHFPTGIVTPISRRAELLAWACEQENRYIIEDDYDCEFRFTGRPIPTMAGIDRHDRVIYMNTFSKSLTPSIRISYMVLPESLADRFRKELGFYSCTVSNFEQMTLAAFLAEGYFEKHINRLRNYYRTKRNYLMNAFLNSFPAGEARIDKEDAGLHFLLHLETNLSDDEIKARAQRNGIRVTCLSDYYEEETEKTPHQYERRETQEGKRCETQEGKRCETQEGKSCETQEDKRCEAQEDERRETQADVRREPREVGSRIEMGTLVINYSGISTEDILTAAEKLHEILK